MSMPVFEKTFFSRFVLCGEHAVLRGGEALVYPLPRYRLKLRYEPLASASAAGAAADPFPRLKLEAREGEPSPAKGSLSSAGLKVSGEELKAAFLSFVSAAGLKLEKPPDLSGRLFLDNSIPLGAGLASSAAMAAGAAWLFQKAGVKPASDHEKPLAEFRDIASFAVALESAFHGQSSGMDVQAVVSGKPLLFKKGAPLQERPFLDKRLRPLLFLSFSSGGGGFGQTDCDGGPEAAAENGASVQRAGGSSRQGSFRSTKRAVSQVNRLFRENPEKARAIDDKMAEAVRLAKGIAGLKTKAAVFDQLKLSIDSAESCFREWGLVPPPLDNHIARLKKAGAAAAKPGGAGLSGAVISLWRRPPPRGMTDQTPLSL